MKIRNVVQKVGLVLGLGLVAGSAMAQTTGSLSALANVFSGLDTTDVISALVGAAAIKVGPGFAKWAANKVASFFR
ncbi:hypothetical protein [Dyella psychrodurans]|uniref:hypothetical protein n=1 Tax=Dyella psychrodurans TaxID=1927960 RepID=UPI001F18963B|nr:hypothetical protein [Dyella psychrodurans]